MEGRDVDLAFAQQRAEAADEARLVVVGDVEHVRRELGVDLDALDLDDARMLAAEKRARDRARVLLGRDREADHRIVIGLTLMLDLRHLDAALAGDHRGVDHVDRRELRPQHAHQRHLGQRLDVELRHLAFELDRDGLDVRVGQLAGEGAQLLGEVEERRQLRRVLGRDVRHVERVGDGARQEVVGHLLGDLKGHVLLRLDRRGAEMRRADQVRRTEQHVLLGRLLHEHVEARARDMARDQQVADGQLVDQAAAGAVDDAHALLGLHQVGPREDVLGLLSERRVHRDEVGARQHLLQRCLLYAELGRSLVAQERVVGHHAHLEADGALGDDRADVAASDQAQRLEAELGAHELVLFPLAGLRAGIGLRHLTGDGEHQRDGVFRRGDGVAERRVHDDDAV